MKIYTLYMLNIDKFKNLYSYSDGSLDHNVTVELL